MQKHLNCLIASAAMLLETDPVNLVKEIGHDGTEVWWPERAGASRMRSIHIREIIECVRTRRRGLMPIELYPVMAPDEDTEPKLLWSMEEAVIRFEKSIRLTSGLLIGQTSYGLGHACAWDGDKVFDPRGYILDLKDFIIRECWLLI